MWHKALQSTAMGILYKFRDFKNPYHRRLLQRNELWFASPEQFNDPFDCNIPIRVDKCPEDWLRQHMIEYALDENPSMSREEARKEVDEELGNDRGPEYRQALRRHQFKEVVSPKTGVVSFTRHWNQKGAELMWAHYANSHSGFVVGLDETVMLSWMKEISGVPDSSIRHPVTEGLNIRPAPVCYVQSMPAIVPCEDEAHEAVYKLVTHKALAWGYENEIRYLMSKYDENLSMISLTKKDRAQTFPDEAIKEVTLGVNVSVENAKWVKDELSKKKTDVKLFWARLKEGEFGLDRMELNADNGFLL